MRILAVSSQVVYGPVGLTAAVPALEAFGHEVLAMPTITLSNHPGPDAPAGFRTSPGDLRAMLQALERLHVLQGCRAVLTGYFASAAQVNETAEVIRRMRAYSPPPFIVVDPVLGDDDALYVPEDVAAAIRDELLPLADCITPNRFELAWLSRLPVTDEASAITAARSLRVPEVLATSVPAGGDLATLAITATACHRVLSPRLTGVPHGTGDLIGALYLAERLQKPPEAALPAAVAVLNRAIAKSAGTGVLQVAAALHGQTAASKQPSP